MSEGDALVANVRSLSTRVATFNRRTIAEQDAFAEDVNSLSRKIDEFESSVKDSKDEASLKLVQIARSYLRNGPGGDLRNLRPRRSPWLLRFLLGEKTIVPITRPDSTLAVKQEYQIFRSRVAWTVTLCPLLLIYGLEHASQSESMSFRPLINFGIQLFLTWLCYIYISLALRENVLYVNGSNIRGWWIVHHYISIVTCLILLSLPVDSPAFTTFCGSFLKWSALQGVVMVVQSRYQRRRMYTRIALGKNSALDTVTSESSGMQGQLLVLYPLLFLLQFWQIEIGLVVCYQNAPAFASKEDWLDPGDSSLDLKGRRGVFIAGLLFLFMGTMNFFQTVATIVDKSGRKKKEKLKKP